MLLCLPQRRHGDTGARRKTPAPSTPILYPGSRERQGQAGSSGLHTGPGSTQQGGSGRFHGLREHLPAAHGAETPTPILGFLRRPRRHPRHEMKTPLFCVFLRFCIYLLDVQYLYDPQTARAAYNPPGSRARTLNPSSSKPQRQPNSPLPCTPRPRKQTTRSCSRLPVPQGPPE